MRICPVVCMYRGAHKKVYDYCFMKQKCQIQMGITWYKNAATPALPNEVSNFVLVQETQKLSAIRF